DGVLRLDRVRTLRPEAIHHAREGNHRAGAQGCGPRQVDVDTGWRVRPRGDAPHPRGQARRAIAQTGDRNRAVKGAASRREAAGARTWEGVIANATQGRARCRQGKAAEAAVRQAVPGGAAGVEARAALVGVAVGTGEPGARRGDAARPEVAAGGGEEGGADQGPGRAPRGGAQGGADARAVALASTRRDSPTAGR